MAEVTNLTEITNNYVDFSAKPNKVEIENLINRFCNPYNTNMSINLNEKFIILKALLKSLEES